MFDDQHDELNLSDTFIAAMALKRAPYVVMDESSPQTNKAVILNNYGYQSAVTHGDSHKPIIGTRLIGRRIVVFAHFARREIAAMRVARAGPEPYASFAERADDLIDDLVDLTWVTDDDMLDIHVVGGHCLNPDLVQTESVRDDALAYQAVIKMYLDDLVQDIEARPNMSLKTFDVWDKSKPNSVAIDSKSGELFIGHRALSKYMPFYNEDNYIPDFYGCDIAALNLFDGWKPWVPQ